ncbi:unnamed protein product [Calicophoron daubneyi]|uniref:Uncharacterized protein n=1 Tax=Calicophoron daubneyi TaxID=300641 RepID=A0AAV2TRD2_CALDB
MQTTAGNGMFQIPRDADFICSRLLITKILNHLFYRRASHQTETNGKLKLRSRIPQSHVFPSKHTGTFAFGDHMF